MAMKRGRPGSSQVRTGKRVGPDYPAEDFRNPFNAGEERMYDAGDGKRTLVSPTENTVTGADQPLHKGKYDRYWEGK